MSFELRLGDCLDPVTGLASLGDRSIDHVICDPPYSRDLYLRFRTNKGARGRDATSVQTRNHLALANEAIGAVDDICEPAAAQFIRLARRWIVVFHDAESGHLWRAAFGERYVRTGVWVKPNGVPQISGDRPSQGCEFITIAHAKGRKRWNGGGRPAVWIENAVNAQPHAQERIGNDHPCPKPELLMGRLIRDFTDPGDLICDPFAGSGTTGVAAIRLGRRFIGWERDPKYHAAATQRLSLAREQLDLPIAPPERVRGRRKQLSLLASAAEVKGDER